MKWGAHCHCRWQLFYLTKTLTIEPPKTMMKPLESNDDRSIKRCAKSVRDIFIPFTIKASKTVVNYSLNRLRAAAKTRFKFTTNITDGFPVQIFQTWTIQSDLHNKQL